MQDWLQAACRALRRAVVLGAGSRRAGRGDVLSGRGARAAMVQRRRVLVDTAVAEWRAVWAPIAKGQRWPLELTDCGCHQAARRASVMGQALRT